MIVNLIKASIPHICALSAGMYVGHCERYGAKLTETEEYLLLTTPTIAITSITGSILMMNKLFCEETLEKYKAYPSYNVKTCGLFAEPTRIEISRLPLDERKKIISNLEEVIGSSNIPVKMAKVVVISAMETALGYVVGRYLL